MFNPRQLLAMTFLAGLIFLSSSLHVSTASYSRAAANETSQANERERGIDLYEQGDMAGSIQALQAFVKQQKKDVRAWHYLGMALHQNGKTNEARKAYEKAVKFASELLTSQLDEMSSPKELYARIGPLRTVLEEGAESADKYIELSSKMSRSKMSEWRERSELLLNFARLSDELNDDHVFGPLEVTTKARILSKPIPGFTEEARQNQTAGKVVLLVILTADGAVKGFIPLRSLPYGLTEKAVEAARQIRFSPAIMNGKPVSQFIRVEYHFNIY